MTLSVNISGTSFTPGRVVWVNNGGWTAGKVAWVKNGSTWTQFYTASIGVVCNPTAAVVTLDENTHTTPPSYGPGVSSSIGVTIDGGIGPFTYSWSATVGFSVSTPGAATTTVTTAAGSSPPINSGTLSCTVTDSATGLKATGTCALSTNIILI